jgi:hypothetical protein
MSEDFSLIKPQMKIDERGFALNLCESLEKKHGDAEAKGGFSGLSPLRLFSEIHDKNLNGDSLDQERLAKEDLEELRKSSGLTPLHPGGEIHNRNLNSVSPEEGFPAAENIETLINYSGLTPLRPGGEIYKRGLI